MMFDESFLAQLHDALGETLLKRIRDGEATAADLNCARQWLKDNGIEARRTASNPLGQLADHLPQFDDDTDDGDLPLIN
jgi:hypothetical protein